MNEHTCQLLKNVLNVQTMSNEEINSAQHHYSKNCILILYNLKGLKRRIFLSIPQLSFTINECKIDSDLINRISMPVHHLSVQSAVLNTSYCK